MMIPAKELALLQGDANRLLDQSATLQRVANTKDAYGSNSEAWNTVWTGNVGLNRPTGTLMQLLATKVTTLATWVVTFPVGTDVRANDRVQIGSHTLHLQDVLTPESYPLLLCTYATENT